MAVPKIIPYDVELRSVNPVRSFDRPKAYTNDLKSVEFQFKILDMTSTDLETATAITLVYMRDGSFFANPSTDVKRVGNVFSYLLKENEGNHAGVAQIQLVVTIDDAEFASQLFDFEIINGLETKVAQEVMIYDWTTLTRDARAYIDQFVADEVFRDAQFDNAQFDRNTAFVASQDARALAFGTEQTNRGTAFTAEQNERTTAFNESESGRTTAETGRVTAESNRVTAETGRTTAESNRVTAENNRVTAEGNRVTAESGRVTAESGRATTFAGYNARITGMETDVNANGTNLVVNGDFSNGTTGWGYNGATLGAVNGEATLLASTQYGGLNRSISLIDNNLYYVRAKIKSTSKSVFLTLQKQLGYDTLKVYHSGSGTYENLSAIGNIGVTSSPQVRVIDSRASGWDTVYIDDILVIDLTATFGKGNEPTAEQMDALLAKFPNSWFNGTANLFQSKQALVKQIALDARTEFEAKNLVVNGDFSNGTTGWIGTQGTISVSNGVLVVTGSATNYYSGATAYTSAVWSPGSILYVRGKMRLMSDIQAGVTSTTMFIQAGGSTGSNVSMGTVSNPVKGSWYTVKGLVTHSNQTGTILIKPYISLMPTSELCSATIELVDFLVIDLTAAFGAGKEPTLAEMDRLMARFPNSWFDGVKPIQTIETLYQEKANKAQEAWITPTLLNGWVESTPIRYRKNEFGKVEFKGRVKSGTIDTPCLVLPSGYRPSVPRYFPVVSNNASGYSFVDSAGAVVINNAAAKDVYVSLDTISFYAD